MKKIGLIGISLAMLVVSSFGQSGDVRTYIDNNKYWIEKANEGKATLNPVVPVPAATYGTSLIMSSVALEANSEDVELTGLSDATQSENSVFVSPNEFDVINSNNSTTAPVSGVGVSSNISKNKGRTWRSDQFFNTVGYCDPAVVVSNSGRMFINYINTSYGQGVSFSDDKGSTWTDAVVANASYGAILDKNHLWIDNSPRSNHDGNLYAAWTDFYGSFDREIAISRSTNGGSTWSTPISISDNINAGSHNQGINICTGPQGQVYAVWAVYDSWGSPNYFENAIGFASSTNGGQTFNQAQRIMTNIEGVRSGFYANNVTGKNMRVNSFPSMAVDISGNANDGTIYVVWANVGVPGVNNGDADIYLIRSTNGDTTWSTPIRVNQDPIDNGAVQYFPWITCDPVTGDLAVVFYDDRNVGGTEVEVFVALSQDGGDTWDDFRVSDVSFTPTPIPGLASGYMGDYIGITSRNGVVYPVWTDNRSGNALTYCSPFVVDAECLDNVTLTNGTVWNGEYENYSANVSISVAGGSNSYVVQGNGTSGGKLVLTAGESLTLQSGFKAEAGSKFVATLGICGINHSLLKKANSQDVQDVQENVEEQPMDNPAELTMKVYPNPNQGLFSIDLDSDVINEQSDAFIMLTDLMGKSYMSHQVEDQNTMSVDISNLTPGVYVVHLYVNGNLFETQRILLK